MDEEVKRLVGELPAIIQNTTKISYDDVQTLIKPLLKYVKKPMAAKSRVMEIMDDLLSALLTRHQEKNANICKHIKNIRQVLDVGTKGNASNSPSSGNNGKQEHPKQILGRIPSGLPVSTTPNASRKRARSISGRLGRKASCSNPDTAGQKARPHTGNSDHKAGGAIRDARRRRGSLSSGNQGIDSPNGKITPEQGQRVEETGPTRSETTHLEKSMEELSINIQHAEEEFQGGSTNEVRFFEKCMIRLKGMFNDNTEDPVEKLIPPPKMNIKEKVKTNYKYIVDIAGEIRRLNIENQYLKQMLDGLHKNLLGGEQTSRMELKPPKDIQNDQSILELETNTKEVIQNFHEMEMETEYAAQLLEEFNKLDNVKQKPELILREPPKHVTSCYSKDRVKDQKSDEENKRTPISRHFEQLKKNLASASNMLKKQIDMKNAERERECLLSILDVLHQHVQELSEGKAQGDILSPLDQIESSIDQKSPAYQGLTQAREISAIQKKWKSESEKLKGEWECLLSILDNLHKETQHLSEGKSHNVASTLLDHMTSSIDKESSACEMFKKAREISSIQMEWKREAEYAAQLLEELDKLSTYEGKQETQFVLRQPPTQRTSDSSNDRNKDKKRNTQNEETPSSRHVKQLQETFASASNILKKQMEDEYAARLLEELGNFSFVTKRDRTGKVFTDPPKKISQNADATNTERRDTSGNNSQLSVHSEKWNIHYNNASHVLDQMKEKEDLRAELAKNTTRLENMKKKHENLTDQNSKLMQQVDSLRTRLSEFAGAKLTHENASIADLSDPNRPTKLAEMYSELYDNQWTDAFENLSKRNPKECDETLIYCLYNILTDIYVFCQQIRDKQKSTLAKIMFDPAKYIEESEERQTNEVSEILAKHLSEAAKLSSNVASANMVTAFVTNEDMKKKYRKVMTPCRTFIEECVKLCWHMKIQTPPVCIDLKTGKGQVFARDMYREYMTKGPKIAFVVWPALFLHDRGPILVKGVAQGE